MKKNAQLMFFGFALAILSFVFVLSSRAKEPLASEVVPEGGETDDTALIEGLLRENLSSRVFDFSVVSEAVAGKKILPVSQMKSRDRVIPEVVRAIDEVVEQMNRDDSPLKGLRRINEGSRFFEDALLEKLDAVDGISCVFPATLEGKQQRSGYPDLRITDEETGEIYYLDPKLMEQGSVSSSFRTFYFEPKKGTLKITDDAAHLLVGIEHDGVNGNWTFLAWHLVDLSGLKVRLKAEFQASNRELYTNSMILEKGESSDD